MNNYETMKLAEMAMIYYGVKKKKCHWCKELKICQGYLCVECYCKKIGRGR